VAASTKIYVNLKIANVKSKEKSQNWQNFGYKLWWWRKWNTDEMHIYYQKKLKKIQSKKHQQQGLSLWIWERSVRKTCSAKFLKRGTQNRIFETTPFRIAQNYPNTYLHIPVHPSFLPCYSTITYFEQKIQMNLQIFIKV